MRDENNTLESRRPSRKLSHITSAHLANKTPRMAEVLGATLIPENVSESILRLMGTEAFELHEGLCCITFVSPREGRKKRRKDDRIEVNENN